MLGINAIKYNLYNNFSLGILLAPNYQVNDNINVGLNYSFLTSDLTIEQEFLLENRKEDGGRSIYANSFLLTGSYRFMPEKSFKPFLGLGLGMSFYAVNSVDETENLDAAGNAGASLKLTDASSFLISPKAGFEYNNWKFHLSYNLATSTSKAESSAAINGLEINNQSNLEFGLVYSIKIY